MPSINQGGAGRDRDTFSDPHADEAARFLDQDLIHDSDRKGLVFSLIDGIENLDRCRAWKAAEKQIGRSGGSARSAIISRLEDREDEILARGSRRDRIPYGPRESCDCCDPEDLQAAVEVARENRQEKWDRTAGVWQSSYEGRDEGNDAGEASSLGDFGQAVATDGGEDQ